MAQTVLAIGCHPDDIEFMMAGALLLLKDRGCDIHYLNVANGNCGSVEYGVEELAIMRRAEAMDACAFLGAHFHESITNDLEVFYEDAQIRKVTAVVREVRPDILFLMSPEDYMEDHMNACRLGVTAAFCRGMPNYRTIPEREDYRKDIAVYHALPYGLRDGLDRLVLPDFYVDIAGVIERKQEMLRKHRSQQAWLDTSQGLNSYLASMRSMAGEVGRMSSRCAFAEGFRLHNHLGFSETRIDPLRALLADLRYDAGLSA
jgi:LmbE family N-acetylglucosaminyl deacetylase